MKNKLFYLFGVALLLCYTGTFTSCINGVDDEYLDQIYTGGNDTNDGEEEEFLDISGDYCENGDYALKMSYNGEELIGKKVTVMADENLETATFTLAGTEKDLSTLTGLLEGLDSKFTTYSPVPGEKELILRDVKLFKSGRDFVFECEDIQPTRTVTLKGKIINEEMTIDINHMLANNKTDLLGKWKMGAVKEAGTRPGILGQAELLNNNDKDPTKSSPLFLDWKSDAKVNMGWIPTGLGGALATIEVNRPMTGIFNLLMARMVSSMFVKPSIEEAITKMIEYVAAENTGGMYASYSYTGAENPEYSQDMSRIIMRYYYEDENKCRIEVNADFLLSIIGGLLNGTSGIMTRAQPDNAKILASELVGKLRPALEQGIPCEYTIDGDNMTINIEGTYLLDVFKTISKLINDEFVVDYIHGFIDGEPSIADYAQAIKDLLRNMENALTEECQYIKLGLRMVRAS